MRPLTDHESDAQNSALTEQHSWHHNLRYLLAGTFFGVILVKAEIISWFRIVEMFRLESFHMYGVIGSAVVVGMLSVQIIKRLKLRTIDGEQVHFPEKTYTKGHIIGGLLFGLGWAMTGACPGPLFAQLGTGISVIAVPLLSAILGTYVYGMLQHRLPN
jgi:uncharacterized protein